VKVLIVDDHHLIREGMRPLLQRLAASGESVEVLEAATFSAALGHVAAHPDLDLVLLDLHLPDAQGTTSVTELVTRNRGLPVVVVSGEDDPALMREVLQHGALGYVPKSSSPDVVLHALRLVLSGATYVPREAMAAAPASAGASGVASPIPARVTTRLGITPRQADVLALLLAGKSNKAICRELDLAEGTVKSHVAAVFKALNVSTRVQAVIAAAKLGIKA
jgi:DNA-binding NarL/FixJ family response regulator